MRIDLATQRITPETPEDIDTILALVFPIEPGFTRFTRKEVATEQNVVVLADTQKDAPRQLTKRAS